MMASTFSTAMQTLRRAYPLRPGPGNPWPLFVVSLKNILLSKKKTPFLLAFLLIPLVVTFLISGSLDTYRTNTNEITAATGGRAWFQDILSAVFFPLILPIVTAVYATGAIGEEVEGKTLPYLFTRPIYRSWILLAKTVSTFAASAFLGIVAVTITYFVAVGYTENPFNGIDQLFGYWSAIALTVLATGGVFLLLGVTLKSAVIIIVIYTFLWETILNNLPIPANVLQYSFAWYEHAYVNGVIHRQAGFLTTFLVDVPHAGTAALVLVVLGALGLLASLLVVSYKDYNV